MSRDFQQSHTAKEGAGKAGWELEDDCGKGGGGGEGGRDDILSWLSLQESSLEARGQQAKELNTSGFAEVLARRVQQMDLCLQNRSLRCQAGTVQVKTFGLNFIYFRLFRYFSFSKIIKVLE